MQKRGLIYAEQVWNQTEGYVKSNQ